MSHNDSILNILGIKDKNIKVISVEEVEHNDIVKGGFKLSFYSGLKMYDLGGLGIDRCQAI